MDGNARSDVEIWGFCRVVNYSHKLTLGVRMSAPANFIIESIHAKRRTAKNSQPYWMARDLMAILSYERWADFNSVIEKAKMACENSGHFSNDHFAEVLQKVTIGSGAVRHIKDYALSKYACYLVTMNGYPNKPEVATAQTYFAEQTHRQEAQDALTDTERRMLLRDRVKSANKQLSSTAKTAGVQNRNFGIFHDEGYKGLYGNLGLREIKRRKGIEEREDFLDRIGRTELAANEFRITQAEEKLRRENIRDEAGAFRTHRKVGEEVRKTIHTIGGVMPEQLPAEPSIKKLVSSKTKGMRLPEDNPSQA